MKFLVVIAGVVALVAGQWYYVTADDYADIDAVIAHLPSLQAFSDCFLDKGPCNYITQSYKDILQDSVIRACDRCNVPQKQRYGRFLQGLRARLPQEYIAFRQKYDPMNIYMDDLEAELAKYANQPLVQRPSYYS